MPMLASGPLADTAAVFTARAGTEPLGTVTVPFLFGCLFVRPRAGPSVSATPQHRGDAGFWSCATWVLQAPRRLKISLFISQEASHGVSTQRQPQKGMAGHPDGRQIYNREKRGRWTDRWMGEWGDIKTVKEIDG